MQKHNLMTPAGWLALALAACCGMAARACGDDATSRLVVPFTSAEIRVDGKLDEACYQTPPQVETFAIAGQPNRQPPKTKAWLFWQRDRLIFAFDCEEADIVAAPPSSNKHDVNHQDRVELYLWSGRAEDTYYCIEIAAAGALHDYAARFHRRFDDDWSLVGLKFAAARTAQGYRVEGTIPQAALAKMGFRLEPGDPWRLGLFRAAFASSDAAVVAPPAVGPAVEPTWITWVDAKGPQPDFHVPESFGICTLGPAMQP